jgi:8-oxo-dGTP diphosphatase
MITVTAAILVKNSKILIAKRRPAARLPNKWEFPGGKIEQGETPEQCLKRELKEELEIEVTVGNYIEESIYRYDFGTVRLLFYRVYWNGKSIVSKDHQEVRWVSLDDLREMDFAAADVSFVDKLRRGEIEL